jgi:hypothetical protein
MFVSAVELRVRRSSRPNHRGQPVTVADELRCSRQRRPCHAGSGGAVGASLQAFRRFLVPDHIAREVGASRPVSPALAEHAVTHLATTDKIAKMSTNSANKASATSRTREATEVDLQRRQ